MFKYNHSICDENTISKHPNLLIYFVICVFGVGRGACQHLLVEVRRYIVGVDTLFYYVGPMD